MLLAYYCNSDQLLMYHVLKGNVNSHLFQNTVLNADALLPGGMAYGDPVQNK